MSETTPHNHPVVFGRRVQGCPRCDELKAGAAPVQGWGAKRKEDDAKRLQEIRNHDCKKSKCGPVCTFGDW
jgi:hypothetical protein